MRVDFLWRNLTLDKYEKLLESRSIYFPRASRLSDKLEGSWLGYVLHTNDCENRIKYTQISLRHLVTSSKARILMILFCS